MIIRDCQQTLIGTGTMLFYYLCGMKIEDATRREFGKLLIDIGKYTVTTIIVGSFFKSFTDTWMVYAVGLLTIVALFTVGFWHFNKSNHEKNK